MHCGWGLQEVPNLFKGKNGHIFTFNLFISLEGLSIALRLKRPLLADITHHTCKEVSLTRVSMYVASCSSQRIRFTDDIMGDIKMRHFYHPSFLIIIWHDQTFHFTTLDENHFLKVFTQLAISFRKRLDDLGWSNEIRKCFMFTLDGTSSIRKVSETIIRPFLHLQCGEK